MSKRANKTPAAPPAPAPETVTADSSLTATTDSNVNPLAGSEAPTVLDMTVDPTTAGVGNEGGQDAAQPEALTGGPDHPVTETAAAIHTPTGPRDEPQEPAVEPEVAQAVRDDHWHGDEPRNVPPMTHEEIAAHVADPSNG